MFVNEEEEEGWNCLSINQVFNLRLYKSSTAKIWYTMRLSQVKQWKKKKNNTISLLLHLRSTSNSTF